MDINQAQLLATGYRHVLTVGAMNSAVGIGVGTFKPSSPACFVCEMVRAGILDYHKATEKNIHANGFIKFFGCTKDDAVSVIVGRYKTGPECAAIVKSLLSKYGYELDDNGYIIERNWAQEQFEKAINGPKLVGVAAA